MKFFFELMIFKKCILSAYLSLVLSTSFIFSIHLLTVMKQYIENVELTIIFVTLKMFKF